MFKDHYTGSPFFHSTALFKCDLQSFRNEPQSRTSGNEPLRATKFSSYLWLYSLSTLVVLSPNFKHLKGTLLKIGNFFTPSYTILA